MRQPLQEEGALALLASRIEALIDTMGRATLYLALGMIALVATNVLLRYAFSFGSVWSQELEWHLLAAVILLGMSYAMQRGENVRVDVFYADFGPRSKFFVDLLSAVLMLLIAGLFIKLSWPYVMQSYSIGESSADPGGIPFRWLVKGLIPLGFTLLALQSLAALARLLLKERLRRETAGV
jgi:TRAP-type mannitol/chloroaromatic compound transport system permease small subunit